MGEIHVSGNGTGHDLREEGNIQQVVLETGGNILLTAVSINQIADIFESEETGFCFNFKIIIFSKISE